MKPTTAQMRELKRRDPALGKAMTGLPPFPDFPIGNLRGPHFHALARQHLAESCPAQDPNMGAMLLNHLSRPSVRQHGLEIKGEAVVHGEHTMYFIVEAGDEERLREFMQPF